MAILEKAIVQTLKDDPTLSELLSYLDASTPFRSVNLSGAAGTRIDAPWGMNLQTTDWSLLAVVKFDELIKQVTPLDDTAIIAQQDGTGTGRTLMNVQVQFGGAWTGRKAFGSFLNGSAQNSDADVTEDAWYHLGITFQLATNTLRFYLNGQLVGTKTSITPSVATGNFRIGSHKSGSPNLLRGNLAQLRIYSSLVSAGDMEDWYEHHAVPAGTKELEWLFTDGSGTQVTDTSGNARHGTLVGAGATWSEETPFGRRHIYKGTVPDAALQTQADAYLVYNRVATRLNPQFGFMITTMQFSVFAPQYENAIAIRDQLIEIFHRFNMAYLGYGANTQEVKHAWVTNMRDMRDPETKLHMLAVDCDFKHVE